MDRRKRESRLKIRSRRKPTTPDFLDEAAKSVFDRNGSGEKNKNNCKSTAGAKKSFVLGSVVDMCHYCRIFAPDCGIFLGKLCDMGESMSLSPAVSISPLSH